MKFTEYYKRAQETAVFPPLASAEYLAAGVLNESGEFLGKLKKVVRDGAGVLTPGWRADLVKELGDVLWYAGVAAGTLERGFARYAETRGTPPWFPGILDLGHLHDLAKEKGGDPAKKFEGFASVKAGAMTADVRALFFFGIQISAAAARVARGLNTLSSPTYRGVSCPVEALNGEGWAVYALTVRNDIYDVLATLGEDLFTLLLNITITSLLLGTSITEVADINLRKLADRAARGTLQGSGDNR